MTGDSQSVSVSQPPQEEVEKDSLGLDGLIRGSSLESLELIDHIMGDESGPEYTSLLIERLKELAVGGDCVPLYNAWLYTQSPKLALELVEGRWIEGFASHVRTLDHLAANDFQGVLNEGLFEVDALINAALHLRDHRGEQAVACLGRLTNQDAINRVCSAWLETRSTLLAEIIKKNKLLATAPMGLRVYTALLTFDLGAVSATDAEGVETLLECLNQGDSTISAPARHVLLNLTGQTATNALLTAWAYQRTPVLDEIVERAGYVASSPPALRVLSQLRAGVSVLDTGQPSTLVYPLLCALSDEDRAIATSARSTLLEIMSDEEARASLCRLAIEEGFSEAHEIALEIGVAPRDPKERALFYFLSELWDQYERIDFDMTFLRQWFDYGGKELRSRIAQTALRAGRLELVELASGLRHKRHVDEMTGREWRAAFSILRDRRDWQTMWRLAISAPAVWAVPAVLTLHEAGWYPLEQDEADGFKNLVRLATECREDPPVAGMAEQPAYQFTAHSRRVSSLIVNSYFHRSLATGSWDGVVRLWNMKDGGITRSLNAYSHPVSAVAATPDGSCLFAGSGAHSAVHTWNIPEGKFAFSLGGHAKGVSSMAVSPDGRLLCVGGFDNNIYLWRLRDKSLISVMQAHRGSIRCLAFSHNGELLASGSEDNRIAIWLVQESRLETILEGHEMTVRSVAFTPDSDLLVSGSSDNQIILWAMQPYSLHDTLIGHENVVTAVAVSGDGLVIASAGWDQTIRLWEKSSGNCLCTLRGHNGPVTCLATDPESRTLVSGGNDSRVMTWNFQSGILRRTPRRHEMETAEHLLRNCRAPFSLPWYEFLVAQMTWRWRYDIQLMRGHPRMQVGEFDIEIMG